jgi:enoyl-[acyl-carrier protein] reductase I
MGALMQGRRGVIMGVANDHSIAWGIARRLAAEGAELVHLSAAEHDRRDLAASLGCDFVIPATSQRHQLNDER